MRRKKEIAATDTAKVITNIPKNKQKKNKVVAKKVEKVKKSKKEGGDA